MDPLSHSFSSSPSSYHITELSSSAGSRGNGTIGPLFVVLAIIMVLGVVAGFIGRVCAGRHWGGDTQYDFEGWVEKRCASCIDGDIEAPPPPPEKPPDPAAPPPPPADAPPPDAPPPAADGAAPPAADAPPPPADAAPAPAPEGGDAAAAPAPAEAAPPPEAPPAEAAPPPPPPSEPLPPPPPPPPPPEAGGAAAAYAGSRMEPLTYMQLYPSYSCRCHICAREGIFE